MESKVFKKIRKKAPQELDFLIRRKIRRHRAKVYALVFSLTFVFSTSLGAILASHFLQNRLYAQGLSQVEVVENPHNKVYPGFVPVRLSVKPPGVYSYTVYLNGEEYESGYLEKELEDTVYLADPVNNIEVEISDDAEQVTHYISWVVFNF